MKTAGESRLSSALVEAVRLLDTDESLYGVAPQEIAARVERKLNELESNGYCIYSLAAIPDYHGGTNRDGGVKDIIFLVKSRSLSIPIAEWRTALVSENSSTLCGEKMSKIMNTLESTLRTLQSQGHSPELMIAITDHHSNAGFFGPGGTDGLKNLILCYRVERN